MQPTGGMFVYAVAIRRAMLRGLAAGGLSAGIVAGIPLSPSWADVGHRQVPRSDPENSGGWVLDPQFSDEFIGRHLDPRKWYDHITYWEGRAPSYFDPKNVVIQRGRATIPFRNVNAVTNPSFQDGLAAWKTSGAGVRTIDEGSVSPTAAELDPGTWVRLTVTGLLPLTTYRISVYGKSGGARGILRAEGYDGAASSELPITSDTYQPVGFAITIGEGSRSATVSVENVGSSGPLDATMVAVVDTRHDAPVGSYFSTGAIQSKTMAHYGYYEVRARIADSSSTSSFWFQGTQTEIDVMECIGDSVLDPGYDSVMPMNLHYFPGGWANDQSFPVQYDTGVRLPDDFHTYGVDWREESIRFYFDGHLVRTFAPNDYWHEPEYLFLDSEAFLWYGFPPADTLPSVYQIEYVRGWHRG